VLDYDKAHTEILFEVWDYDRIGKNEFLGKFVVSIPSLPPNKEVARLYRLEERGRKGEQALASIFVGGGGGGGVRRSQEAGGGVRRRSQEGE